MECGLEHDLRPGGNVLDHPGARQGARVCAREDDVVVDAVDESLCSQPDCCDGESRGEQAGPHAAERIRAGNGRITGEEAGERKDREEPAAEEPLLRGHVDEE